MEMHKGIRKVLDVKDELWAWIAGNRFMLPASITPSVRRVMVVANSRNMYPVMPEKDITTIQRM